MERHAMNNKERGFSLIELMIAMMIIAVSMLALLTSMITAINANRSNEIRNTAIIVANQTAEALLALPINDAELSEAVHSRIAGNAGQTGKGIPDVSQKVRGALVNYAVQWTVSTRSLNLKQVDIAVSYSDKNNAYTYSSVIYKHSSI